MKRLWVLVLSLLVLASVGCDSMGEAEVEGTWQARPPAEHHLTIETAEVTYYEQRADEEGASCYSATPFEVLDISGDTYTLKNTNSQQPAWKMTVNVEGNVLTAVYENDVFGTNVVRYIRTSRSVQTLLPECDPAG